MKTTAPNRDTVLVLSEPTEYPVLTIIRLEDNTETVYTPIKQIDLVGEVALIALRDAINEILTTTTTKFLNKL